MKCGVLTSSVEVTETKTSWVLKHPLMNTVCYPKSAYTTSAQCLSHYLRRNQ